MIVLLKVSVIIFHKCEFHFLILFSSETGYMHYHLVPFWEVKESFWIGEGPLWTETVPVA